MTPRQMTVLGLVALAGVILVLWQHQAHTDQVLSALSGPQQPATPISSNGILSIFFAPRPNQYGTTNNAQPSSAGSNNGLAAMGAATPQIGAGVWLSSIWDSLAS